MSTHSPRVRTRSIQGVACEYSCAAKPPSCSCACTPYRAHIRAFSASPTQIAGAPAPPPPPPTADAVDDTSTPPLTAGVSTPSTPGQYVEHSRVLSRCTHLPALRCAADDSAADSTTPSHAAIAPPHLSVSSKAEPSTDPNERTPQPGSAPAGSCGRRRSTSGRFRAAAARVVGAAALPAIPSFPRTHALRGIAGATRRLHISH